MLPPSLVPSDIHELSSVREIRSVLDKLTRMLTDSADPSLPIRRVRGVAPCLHYGGDIDAYRVPKITNPSKKIAVIKKNIILPIPNASLAPGLTLAVPVYLDITHRKNMKSEMFRNLKMAFLINLKKSLEDNHSIKAIIKNNVVVIEFQVNNAII